MRIGLDGVRRTPDRRQERQEPLDRLHRNVILAEQGPRLDSHARHEHPLHPHRTSPPVCWTAEGNRIHDVIVGDIRPDVNVIDLQRAAPDNRGEMRQRGVLEVGDDLLDDGVVAAGGLGSSINSGCR
jgi:hypothetical protein